MDQEKEKTAFLFNTPDPLFQRLMSPLPQTNVGREFYLKSVHATNQGWARSFEPVASEFDSQGQVLELFKPKQKS